MSTNLNYCTKAAFYAQGITGGFIEADEIIAWADEVIVESPTMEDWMLEISTCGPNDRTTILSHLNTVKGDIDQAGLTALLAERGR
jgi:hypothetical protein